MAPDTKPTVRAPHWRLITDQAYITDEVRAHPYQGDGTEESPYVVDWIPNDPRNPQLIPQGRKWLMTVVAAFGTLSVSFASTSFSGAIPQVQVAFGVSDIIATLTVSLFVLGFAIGPMVWAPLAELYGRQVMWFFTLGLMALFSGCSIAAHNIQTLIVLRAFAGAIGASSIANSAGIVADVFTARDRGIGMTLYCSAPFLGPTLGPIVGNWAAPYLGWKWVDGIGVLLCFAAWIAGVFIIPETYAPRLLQVRAAKLTKLTGKPHISRVEAENGRKLASAVFKKAMIRPWKLLFHEPIVLIIATYMAIVYGTLYLVFSAFPIVFSTERHWSQGISGLSFISNMLGQICALLFAPFFIDPRYKKKLAIHGYLQPEQRLIGAMMGSVFLPIGLFWFAWTTYSSIHWIVCMLGSGVFGFGEVSVFLALLTYITDAYSVYAGSALAANAVFRAVFAATFPLFTPYMYRNLGTQWASSVPAFLGLACTPFPFLFFRYGRAIRSRCKYSAEAMRISESMYRESVEKTQAQKDDEKTITDGSRKSDEEKGSDENK